MNENQTHAALLAKVKSGCPLTPEETASLAALAAGELKGAGWARNQIELANALGVDRKTIQRWMQEPDNPGRRADGRYNVAAWRSWADQNGKKYSDGLPTQTSLKARQLLLQNERLEFDLGVKKGKFVPAADVEKWVGDMVMQAKKVLLAMPSSLAPQVVGLTVAEAEKVIKDTVVDALEQLHSAPLGTP